MHEKHRKTKDLPLSERPYEKCLSYGAGTLSDAELLGIILRVGTKNQTAVEVANSVLLHSGYESGLVGLYYATIEDLMSIPGIGMVKAVQLKCVAELAVRIAKQERKKMVKFHQPRSVADYYMQEFRFKEQEQVLLVMLDTKGRLIKDALVSSGTVNLSIVDPREIFTISFQNRAVQIILLHNHPSGDPTPSKQDLLITQRIKEAGSLVGVELIDHIIIGDNQYISMREKKLL